ncbi:MAG TPA: ankyrin repeat domain-containing protein [Candidatus Goldiibacteriota bacterium]|nr:ankyrin repeat domain-containing protein [Candidatus Goldiibacteriota bacterium]
MTCTDAVLMMRTGGHDSGRQASGEEGRMSFLDRELHDAFMSGDMMLSQSLVRAGASMGRARMPSGQPLLMRFMARNDIEKMKQVMALGGPDVRDPSGLPAIVYSINNMSKPHMLDFLLESGADPDITLPDSELSVKGGLTPGQPLVMTVVHAGRFEVARKLLDAGARLDRRDSFGRTPLMAAALRIHFKYTGKYPEPRSIKTAMPVGMALGKVIYEKRRTYSRCMTRTTPGISRINTFMRLGAGS